MCVPSEINATLSAKTPSERMHYDIESESTWHLLYINCVAKYGSQITPANCDSQIIIGGGGYSLMWPIRACATVRVWFLASLS